MIVPIFFQTQVYLQKIEVIISQNLPGIHVIGEPQLLKKNQALKLYRTLKAYYSSMNKLFTIGFYPQTLYKHHDENFDLTIALSILHTQKLLNIEMELFYNTLSYGQIDLVGNLEPLPLHKIFFLIDVCQKNRIKYLIGNMSVLKTFQKNSVIQINELTIIHCESIKPDSMKQLELNILKKVPYNISPQNKIPNNEFERNLSLQKPILIEYVYDQQREDVLNKIEHFLKEDFKIKMGFEAEGLTLLYPIKLQHLDNVQATYMSSFDLLKHWQKASENNFFPYYALLEWQEHLPIQKSLISLGLIQQNLNLPLILLYPTCFVCSSENKKCNCSLYERHRNSKNIKSMKSLFKIKLSAENL